MGEKAKEAVVTRPRRGMSSGRAGRSEAWKAGSDEAGVEEVIGP